MIIKKLADGSMEVTRDGQTFTIAPEDELFQVYLIFFIVNPDHRHVGLY